MTNIVVRPLGQQPYQQTWDAMREFTDQRDETTPDEFWTLEHDPIYTLGRNGKEEHLLNPGDIPIVKSDRGGQVTYHGPGQLIVYVLISLNRWHIGVRNLVSLLENSVVDLLAEFDIEASGRPDAPGVYVGEKKIASLGLRIRRQYSYHGIGFNIDTDLAPFTGINPCGYPGLSMTRLIDFRAEVDKTDVAYRLTSAIQRNLNEHLRKKTHATNTTHIEGI